MLPDWLMTTVIRDLVERAFRTLYRRNYYFKLKVHDATFSPWIGVNDPGHTRANGAEELPMREFPPAKLRARAGQTF
jgi:hypothetical protein